MTMDEKASMVLTLLNTTDFSIEGTIATYLEAAGKEIIAWRYSYTGGTVTEVPPEYEMTQIYAVINGYSQSGAEGQVSHSENGISRTFKYTDMLRYIRANVVPMCGVM